MEVKFDKTVSLNLSELQGEFLIKLNLADYSENIL